MCWTGSTTSAMAAHCDRATRRRATAAAVATAAIVAIVVALVLVVAGTAGGSSDSGAAVQGTPPPGGDGGKVRGHVRLTTNFTYEGETGPDNWGFISPTFATCATGLQQSPVDIVESESTAWAFASAPLIRQYSGSFLFDIVSRPAHPGFQVQPANLEALNDVWVVDGERFKLVQFHFHNPSEHEMHGFAVAAELHFVHMSASGRVAVFGIMFEEDLTGSVSGQSAPPDNPFLAGWWDVIHTPTANVTIPLSGLINDVQEIYWRYNGSLTTPPCSEAVAWHVTMSRTPMSPRQVEDLRFAIGEENRRPVQPLNGREERELSFGPGGASAPATLADLHYGEAPSLPWGPMQDRNSSRVMRSVFAAEAAAGLDLAVFSGDQMTGNNVEANATAVMAEVFTEVVAAGVPFATIFGNHDDAPLDPPRRLYHGLSTTTRRELLAFESTYSLSRTCRGNDGQLPEQCPVSAAPSVTNYLILLPNATAPRAVLYFLDSGGGSYDESLLPSATAWLANATAAIAREFGAALPSIAFVHIPPPEYVPAYQPASGACAGMADDGITPTVGENDLIAVLRAAGGARAVFVGHDHGNTWCCRYEGISLCYGRHTGYGGYGDWDRGARIVELQLEGNATAPGAVGVRTYVRMEDGSTNSKEWL